MEMNATIADDSTMEHLIRPYRDSLEMSMNQVLVRNPAPLTRGIPESPLGNLVADLLLERAVLETPDSVRPLICLINIGGLRVDLPAGDITVGKVFELMPFDNELDIVKISATQVDSMLHYLRSVGGQPVAGIHITMDPESDSISFSLDDRTKIGPYLYVATSDYLAEGGDNMTFFKDPLARIRTGIRIRDAIMDEFRTVGLAGKEIEAETDGRIVIRK